MHISDVYVLQMIDDMERFIVKADVSLLHPPPSSFHDPNASSRSSPPSLVINSSCESIPPLLSLASPTSTQHISHVVSISPPSTPTADSQRRPFTGHSEAGLSPRIGDEGAGSVASPTPRLMRRLSRDSNNDATGLEGQLSEERGFFEARPIERRGSIPHPSTRNSLELAAMMASEGASYRLILFKEDAFLTSCLYSSLQSE